MSDVTSFPGYHLVWERVQLYACVDGPHPCIRLMLHAFTVKVCGPADYFSVSEGWWHEFESRSCCSLFLFFLPLSKSFATYKTLICTATSHLPVTLVQTNRDSSAGRYRVRSTMAWRLVIRIFRKPVSGSWLWLAATCLGTAMFPPYMPSTLLWTREVSRVESSGQRQKRPLYSGG